MQWLIMQLIKIEDSFNTYEYFDVLPSKFYRVKCVKIYQMDQSR